MELVYKEESFKIIGKCMEVHQELGHGFAEIVYKDALDCSLPWIICILSAKKSI